MSTYTFTMVAGNFGANATGFDAGFLISTFGSATPNTFGAHPYQLVAFEQAFISPGLGLGTGLTLSISTGGLPGDPPDSFIQSVSFTDQFGTLQTFLGGAAVTASQPGTQKAWQWSGVTPAYFNPGNSYVITVNYVATATVSVAPLTANVVLNQQQQFTATVSDSTPVDWLVNGVLGGDSVHGAVGIDGLYTAPAFLPSPVTVTVTARLQEDPTVTASATVTLLNKLVTVFGKFIPPPAIKGPIMVADIKSVEPRVYRPGDDTTVKSRP